MPQCSHSITYSVSPYISDSYIGSCLLLLHSTEKEQSMAKPHSTATYDLVECPLKVLNAWSPGWHIGRYCGPLGGEAL
jgi:hypothetical protein